MFAWQLECEKLTVQCDRYPLFNLCGQRVKDICEQLGCVSVRFQIFQKRPKRGTVFILEVWKGGAGQMGWSSEPPPVWDGWGQAGVGEPVWVEACSEEKRNERRLCEWERDGGRGLNISGQPSEESWGRLHRMEILEQGCQSEMSCGLLSSHWTATLVFK